MYLPIIISYNRYEHIHDGIYTYVYVIKNQSTIVVVQCDNNYYIVITIKISVIGLYNIPT